MWHKAISLFTKTAFDRIAVVNNHWNHFDLIQRLESGAIKHPSIIKKVTPIQDYYIHFPAEAANKIVKLFELNGPTPFYPLVEMGVDVHPYKKNEYLDSQSQSMPDNVFDFTNAKYVDKRIHGMDNKAYENPREFESRIFSNLSKQKYIDALDNLEKAIISNVPDLSIEKFKAISDALMALKNSCGNIIQHQKDENDH